ncbi:KN motif and ankyrin repeat domain-containing protein 3 isoform X2 [Conger conger]|nr:KN motif and ankyrin repeat domain-containing protein 3 isoform X2 [Conger conger]XP_061094514.1 KN motif and ankyrin repeat domain-containing protein 3 isoform X2 [Conger conger]XP_061094515.1 KN motif and ankyrin repeat domain-containing protein 3 isoform X2 [Conger conger]XP_061094516.1 KN motif and ankyrin repeat domain-containing protein 3 isoform X2 [Conger conger]XP_061094517.1 KN motif and ankyrin repeat domain-containing protein 3 isoform X2 [Conger conger]
MTQVNQKLPDLGAPFLYSTQEEVDQGGSYSVQTPYGFQLDLDFLKYVEEIESGHNFRRALVNPRRGSRGTKLSQRSPGGGGRASGWTSTESLSSVASEDGRVPPLPPPRNRIASAPSEMHLLSPVAVLSPPLSAGPLKVPPPPPARNPRVEKTLLETSRRLQQEQMHLQHGPPFQLADPPKAGPREPVRATSISASSQISPAGSFAQDGHPLRPSSASPSPSQINWNRVSPHTSGRSTPASGMAQLTPGQLQTVREQMAAALRQLKDMEERVKGVPALEREVARLRAEKDRLLVELREKTAVGTNDRQQQQQSPASGNGAGERVVAAEGPGRSTPTPGQGRPSKLVELRRLTEKLGGKDERDGEQPEKVPAPEKVSVERKSVAVGDDLPLEDGVFYRRQAMKEKAVNTSVEVCEKGVGTDATATSEVGVEAKAETEDASVWVMESLLGLTSEAEREIDTLQDTIRFQQESIQVLEGRLSQADQELEDLRAQEEQRKSRVMVEKEVLVKPETANAEVETEPSDLGAPADGSLEKCIDTQSVAVECCPEVVDVGVGQDLRPQKSDQGTQTDPEESVKETAPAAVTSTGSQWESQYEETEKAVEHKPPVPALKRRQMTITECAVLPATDPEERESCEEGPVPSSPAVGMLKSIMKRKDGSSPGEAHSGNKKSLQFVGILNGGYESTSSEEDDEEDQDGSSSEGSGAGDGSDSSEDEEVVQEETSDEERNINLDESDTDVEDRAGAEDEDAEEDEEVVKEKFELSLKMREACLILKNHLNDDATALKSKEVLSSTHSVQLEWFRVSSAKTAQPSRVSDYLMAFSEVSPALLAHVVNMTDGNGNTALHYSVSHSNFTVVGLLLDTGLCCVDQQNKAGYTAIMLAALASVKEEKDMKVVKKLFSQGNVNAKASQAGQTALMLAVSHGRQEMVQSLLKCGASVNVQDDEGSTALMCASEHGRTEIVSLLLEQHDCDISVMDNDGSNALSIALEASHNDIAVLLYAHMNYSKIQAAATPKALPRSPSSPQKI